MTVDNTISRANQQLLLGQTWRAKEILSSSIPNYEYSKELFYALGSILLQMGDDLEAGKFLLLSVDQPTNNEEKAIKIFLERRRKNHYKDLLASFPKRSRQINREDYPTYLRNYLVEIGAPSKLVVPDRTLVFSKQPQTDFMFFAGCTLVAFLTISCFIVGAFTIISWILF